MTALEKTLRWIVLCGIFALPFIVFIVSTSLFFPYITGKNFTFRIIVEISTASWLALALVKSEYRPPRGWILYAFALFVIIVAIADAQGVNPFKSFWSNYERMDGWVTQAHLFAYFVVAISMLNAEKLWRTLWHLSLAASFAAGLYGLLQLAGILALGQGGVSGLEARVDATFGNPIYLAVYMLFHIFLAALLIHQEGSEQWESKERLAGAGLMAVLAAFMLSSSAHGALALFEFIVVAGVAVWMLFLRKTYLLMLVLVLDTVVLFFTGTRGTILGLIGGALLAGFVYLLSGNYSRRAARAVSVGAILVCIAAALLWLARGEAWVHRIGFLDRLATISLNDNTTKARFMNWGMAWEGVKERPILGWGQENYAIVFDKYYNPRMYAQEQWFDRVHNIIFDWLVATGFLGLISYLSLFLCTFLVLQSASFSAVERSIFIGLLAAYFFHNLFVFDNITSYLLFASVLGYIAARAARGERSPPVLAGALISPRALPLVAVASAILLWALAWFTNAAALAQNRTLLQAVAPQKEGILKNLEYFKQSIAYGSYGTQEAREQLAQGSMQIAGLQNVPTSVKQQFFETSAAELNAQANLSPLDTRFPLFLGVMLDAYGDYTDAAPALERARQLSPTKQTILFELGTNMQARGDNVGALKIFKEAFDLAPENQDARIYYAAAAIRAQEDALASELLAPIIPTGGAGNPRIAAAYVARGRYDKIVEIWKAAIKADPSDAQAYFTLAAAYYSMGNPAQAIATLEAAGTLSSTIKTQADALIQEIRSGKATPLR